MDDKSPATGKPSPAPPPQARTSMQLRKPLALCAIVAALVGGTALAASAAPGDTATTFTLNGGSNALSVQTTAALTNGASGTTTISGSLGAVSVTDARGGTAGWVVSALSTGFSRTGGGAASASSAISYTGGPVTETGTITVADGTAIAITADAAEVITAT